MKHLLLSILAAGLLFGSSASADEILLSIGAGPGIIFADIEAGQEVSIPVFGSAPNPVVSSSISGYTVAVDFDGLGVPSFFSDVTFENLVAGTTLSTTTPAPGAPFDFVLGSTGDIDLSSPVQLFNIRFNTDSSTPADVYDINFVDVPGLTAFTGPAPDNTPIVNFQLDGGQFRITSAVPEPNSGMILAGIACLGALRRRRIR